MSDILKQIKEAVVGYQKDRVAGLVREALDQGADPQTVIDSALVGAMDQVGKDFSQGTIFVPEMLVAAMTMKEGLNVVAPRLEGGGGDRGKVLMATVKGDLHDIGKNIVGMMIESAGFSVVDLGVDLSPEDIIKALEEHEPMALGLSALLTTTMPEMKRTIEEIEARGLRQKIKILVGGAPVDRKFAEEIGADGYGRDAAQAVELLRGFSG